MAIERILGTDTGKAAFEKADRNFLGIENGSLPVGSTKSIYTQVITDLNTHNVDGFFKYNSNAVGAYNVLPGIVRHESYDGGLAYQMCAPYGTIGMCVFRVKLNAVWGAWEKVVTDKQESWLTATLQSGWTGSFIYRKNQLNQLEVKFQITAGTTTSFTVITTLPIGYRVADFFDIAAMSPETAAKSYFYYNAGSSSIYVSPNTAISVGQKCAGSFVVPL